MSRTLVCVCVCLASLMVLGGLAVPAALGHNWRSAMGVFFDKAVVYDNAAWGLQDWQCDYTYVQTGTGQIPEIPVGCAFQNYCEGGPGSLFCPSPELRSPFTSASLVNGDTVVLDLDCWRFLLAPPVPGHVASDVTRFGGETTKGHCENHWSAGDVTYGYYAPQQQHWSRLHGATTPGTFLDDMKDVQSIVLNSIPQGSVTLNLWHRWFYTGGVLPLELAHLRDPSNNSAFDSNSQDTHLWNVSDPAGEDRLMQGGQDITPAVGDTVPLDVGVTIKREDAGGGNVIWRLASSLPAKYLVISKETDHAGNRVWAIFPVVV